MELLVKGKEAWYEDRAYVYKLTIDEDGSYNYDFEKCIGYFNILSCKEAFNMTAMIGSECG